MNLRQKPTLINVIAWTTLASGIVNLFWGIAASHTALATVIGIVCVPFTILPTILGIFELIYAAKLFSNPAQPVQPSTNIAILEIACVITGNVFSMAVGILSLVFYNDTVVKDYFARLNGILSGVEVSAPATVTPVEPASTPQPEIAPAIEEPNRNEVEQQSVEEVPAPQEETPAKRTPRKIAKK
jgi:hypothetical protein